MLWGVFLSVADLVPDEGGALNLRRFSVADLVLEEGVLFRILLTVTGFGTVRKRLAVLG